MPESKVPQWNDHRDDGRREGRTGEYDYSEPRDDHLPRGKARPVDVHTHVLQRLVGSGVVQCGKGVKVYPPRGGAAE